MVNDTVHVYPVNDLVEHDTSGEPCICGPATEAVIRDDGSNGWLVVHHSLDGREHHEEALARVSDHATNAAPHECVGLIGFNEAGNPVVFPLTNIASDTEHRFEVSPGQLHEALSAMENEGCELHTIYHSHPSSPALPSQSDIRFAQAWPGINWMIVSLTDDPPIRTWRIDGETVTEIT